MTEPENGFEQERTFVKKVGDQTLTRRVTNPTNEVAARFDGYLPEEEAGETTPTGEAETTAGTAQPPPPPTPPTPPTRTSGIGGGGAKPTAPGSSPS